MSGARVFYLAEKLDGINGKLDTVNSHLTTIEGSLQLLADHSNGNPGNHQSKTWKGRAKTAAQPVGLAGFVVILMEAINRFVGG